jgi:hypothetical protein
MATIFKSDGSPLNVNPFFQQVNGFVVSELQNRASLVGRRVRSVGKSPAKSVEWGYQKTAWAIVQSLHIPSIILGTPGSNVMSDSKGNLTLYNSERNVPNKPLLTRVDITNEGQLGSFMKAQISFTIFPRMGASGFDIGGIEDAFFIPGREINLKWGWSTYANNQRACTGDFTGIVYDFNWNFNPDLSVSATVSIISPSGLAIGMSADLMNTSKETVKTTDAAGRELVGSNLSKVIDSDLSQLSSSIALGDGQTRYVGRRETVNQKLDYYTIGLPIQESQQSDGGSDTNGSRVTKTQWYVKFGAIAQFINELLDDFDDPVKQIFAVQCYGNETQYLADCVSSYPVDVYFPDKLMGRYGQLQPFGQGGDESNPLTSNKKEGTINIGEILLGTDYVKRTYEQFISDNANNIPYKTLPKLLDEFCKRINYASGDMYDLTPVLFEPSINNITGQGMKAILTIEDTNLHLGLTATPYKFEPTIFKPLIRSVNISSQPPPAMAMAAFTAARGNTKPEQSNVRIATKEQRDNTVYDEEYVDSKKNIARLRFNALTQGFSDTWSEELRGFLVKIKRTSNAQDAHWLNNAIYPVKFSVTMDGINGFKFGDTLSTSMIPATYNTTYKMVFTVTKIVHSIENKDWTTQLETSARVTSTGDGAPQVNSDGVGTQNVPSALLPVYARPENQAPLPSTPGATPVPKQTAPANGKFVFGKGFITTNPQRVSGVGTGTGVQNGTTTPGDGSILLKR